MGEPAVSRPPLVAGRVEELRILGAAIQGAAEGRPCAVFVHGEAGVGKTCLVRRICDDAGGRGIVVLWGQCVHFGSVDAPYLPLINALEGWIESAPPSEVSGVLAAVPAAAELLPSLGGQASLGAVRLLPVVDGLVMAIASRRPTVLVVDDVQWADPASRDAITYLVAGFRTQRLAMLMTYRDEELAAGHPLHSWLADLTRLPSVSSVRLNRLSRDETEDQLAALLGGRPHPRLVADVTRRSDGNPYLSELLVGGVALADDGLPAGLPTELTGALLGAWHRLSAPAREVMRMLAVGGRPALVDDDLTEVAAARGIGAEAVVDALVEATNAGICVAVDAETCWFRHPLLADVLCGTLVPGEAGPIHAAWAKALESRCRTGIDELRRQGDLAQHYQGAGALGSCLEVSLRAAGLARDLRALREEALHLSRAARLWPTVHRGDAQSVDQELDLLERLADAHRLAGDDESIFTAWNRAHDLVDERADPLRASRVMRHWASSAWSTGRATGEPINEIERAVELARAFPDSREYAEALAALSESHTFMNAPEAARRYAEQAVQAAHRAWSNEALTHAYRARALAFIREDRSDRDSAECLRFARLTHDPALLNQARMVRSDYLDARGRVADSTGIMAEGLSDTLDAGALNVVSGLTRVLACQLLMFGRLAEAGRVIRQGLALAEGPECTADVRLVAALLSTRRGDLEVARLHLERAREAIPDLDERPGLMAPPILAECLLAAGHPDRALDMLMRTLAVHSVDPRVADEMLLWGARAAADMAQDARDRRDGDRVSTARSNLDALIALRKDLPQRPFEVLVAEDLVQPAMEALFNAETSRCRGETITSLTWEKAVASCEAAGLQWEQMIASWRHAQALLDEGTDPSAAAAPLRAVHQFATSSEAHPLQRHAAALAAIGKIPLQEPVTPPRRDTLPEPFHALTQRELEVLSHLVAGRTYSEIADALFISKKTLSVHVSNLLRKTGTSSRRDVSALALRLGPPIVSSE
ncbi:AAA family ATPase [Kribbella sp. NPDC026596]|uniref:helix-turn-helix transcriptional regulator n=1 Tax=Kribbella sp. NPDC026596 TaxID=3155122 RepID=UPI0033CC134F